MKVDLVLKLGAYALVGAGSWAYFAFNPRMSAILITCAVLSAFARVTFTHERIDDAKSGKAIDLFDSFLTMGAIVTTFGGLSAILSDNPMGSIVTLLIAFVLLNVQIWFTHRAAKGPRW